MVVVVVVVLCVLLLLALGCLALGVTDDVEACSLQPLHHRQHLQEGSKEGRKEGSRQSARTHLWARTQQIVCAGGLQCVNLH